LTLFHGLEKQAETLGRLSAHTLAEQEDAARRFSQEMHDEFGQTLNAIESTLSAVKTRDAVHQARLDDAIGLSKEAQGMAREMSQLLRPRILDDFGLDAGLRELSRGFSRRTGIAVDYTSSFRDRLDPGAETQLFRIAQEALTNTARHTTATTVSLSLTKEGRLLKLRALDNGGGMAGGAPSLTSLGLLGMRERARACGGRLIVTSTPGQGVEVVAEVPWTKPEADLGVDAPENNTVIQQTVTAHWENPV
jgi:signal transduction histidine kinase